MRSGDSANVRETACNPYNAKYNNQIGKNNLHWSAVRIEYASDKDRKLFTDSKKLVRKYGSKNARLIMIRLDDLRDATTLADVSPNPPPRRHKLVQRNEEYAVSVEHPFRLVFTPAEWSEADEAGHYDIQKVQCVVILRVEDYHGGKNV